MPRRKKNVWMFGFSEDTMKNGLDAIFELGKELSRNFLNWLSNLDLSIEKKESEHKEPKPKPKSTYAEEWKRIDEEAETQAKAKSCHFREKPLPPKVYGKDYEENFITYYYLA